MLWSHHSQKLIDANFRSPNYDNSNDMNNNNGTRRYCKNKMLMLLKEA